MHNMHDVASLTVSEFKAFKRALAVLVRAGIDRYTAIDILLSARK